MGATISSVATMPCECDCQACADKDERSIIIMKQKNTADEALSNALKLFNDERLKYGEERENARSTLLTLQTEVNRLADQNTALRKEAADLRKGNADLKKHTHLDAALQRGDEGHCCCTPE